RAWENPSSVPASSRLPAAGLAPIPDIDPGPRVRPRVRDRTEPKPGGWLSRVYRSPASRARRWPPERLAPPGRGGRAAGRFDPSGGTPPRSPAVRPGQSLLAAGDADTTGEHLPGSPCGAVPFAACFTAFPP